MKHTINYVFTKINLPISCDKLSRVFLCLNIIFNLVQIWLGMTCKELSTLSFEQDWYKTIFKYSKNDVVFSKNTP